MSGLKALHGYTNTRRAICESAIKRLREQGVFDSHSFDTSTNAFIAYKHSKYQIYYNVMNIPIDT